jgi:oligosaccharide translocation protein RFT1
VALLTIPIGALLSLLVTIAILATTPTHDGIFHQAIIMQGVAAFIEILSEPLYILATVRLLFGVRVACEALATVAKNAITLGLLLHWKIAPALAFSWGQLGYSVVTLVGFSAYFAFKSTFVVGKKIENEGKESKLTSSTTKLELDRDILRISGTFSLQAGGKLLLAEGSKAVLAAATPLQEQGVYGLVNNLGSLIVRTLFQPYEEIAFVAFSRAPGSGSSSSSNSSSQTKKAKRERAILLSTLCRGASFLGGLAAAFGPAYSYLALWLLYGSRWAESGAPAALALYSCYVALLAVNGILEAFVHAVADQRGLHQANMVLVVVSILHMGLSVVAVNTAGAAGLLIADAINMTLRIFYCLWFIGIFFTSIGGLGAVKLLPKQGTRVALFASLIVTLVSQAVLLPEGTAAVVVPRVGKNLASLVTAPLVIRAVMHVGIGVVCLSGVLVTAYRSEKDVVAQLKSFRKKSD